MARCRVRCDPERSDEASAAPAVSFRESIARIGFGVRLPQSRSHFPLRTNRFPCQRRSATPPSKPHEATSRHPRYWRARIQECSRLCALPPSPATARWQSYARLPRPHPTASAREYLRCTNTNLGSFSAEDRTSYFLKSRVSPARRRLPASCGSDRAPLARRLPPHLRSFLPSL